VASVSPDPFYYSQAGSGRHTTLYTDRYASTVQKAESLAKVKAMQLLEIDALQGIFENMHRNVDQRVSSNRKKQIKHHKKN